MADQLTNESPEPFTSMAYAMGRKREQLDARWANDKSRVRIG